MGSSRQGKAVPVCVFLYYLYRDFASTVWTLSSRFCLTIQLYVLKEKFGVFLVS